MNVYLAAFSQFPKLVSNLYGCVRMRLGDVQRIHQYVQGNIAALQEEMLMQQHRWPKISIRKLAILSLS